MSLAAFQRLHPDYGPNWEPGVDVSGWQTTGQTADACAWAAWVIAKATEGANFVEGMGAEHQAVAREYGKPCGFYHFAQPDRGGAEAELFVRTLDAWGGPGDLPPVLDLETGSGDLNGYTLGWLHRTWQLTGSKPMLYTGASFAESHLGSDELGEFPLWVAHYANAGAAAWVPSPWAEFTVWQYQSVTAEHGHLDVNVARPGFCHGTTHPEPTKEAEDDDMMTLLWADPAEGGSNTQYVCDGAGNCWALTSQDTIGVLKALGKLDPNKGAQAVSPQTFRTFLHYQGLWEATSRDKAFFQRAPGCPEGDS